MEPLNRDTQPLSPLTFRAGVAEDFSSCAELWMHAVALRDGTPADLQVRRKALAKITTSESSLTIAESRSGTSGFALVLKSTPESGAPTAHLSLLAVDPASQSRGLGCALLANVTRSLIAEGFTSLSLRVMRENLHARAMYEKAGWKITGHGVFEDSRLPCVHYRLGLPDDDS